MTFFPDLTPHKNHQGILCESTLNVGWLSCEHGYDCGTSLSSFIERLWIFCASPVVRTRGYHCCDLCRVPQIGPLRVTWGTQTTKLGTAEIRVFGEEGRVYAAPDLIFHYVTEHKYRPPSEFVSAILISPIPHTLEYDRLLAELRLPK